jgi:hypothetical protein
VPRAESATSTGEVLFIEQLDPFAPLSRAIMGSNRGAWRRTTTVDFLRGGFGPVGAAHMHVYRRADHPCRVCGTSIQTGMKGEPASHVLLSGLPRRALKAVKPDGAIRLRSMLDSHRTK